MAWPAKSHCVLLIGWSKIHECQPGGLRAKLNSVLPRRQAMAVSSP
jgi:hypothetical protein